MYSSDLLSLLSSVKWPGDPPGHLPSPAAGEEELDTVHVALVGPRVLDSMPGSKKFFDFGVAEFGEVVEDLVVVLVLHDNVLFSQECSCFVFFSLLCALKLIPA